MRLEDKQFLKDVIKCVSILVVTIFACRISRGYFTLVMAVLGVWWALAKQMGKALSCFAFFPLLIVMDPVVLPKTALMGVVLRLAPLLIGLVLCITANGRRGTNRLPLGGLFIYLAAAAVSSIGGWSPIISYPKLVNFALFVVGIWLGTQNMQWGMREMYEIRIFFISMMCLIIVGSLLTIPFPSISYSTNFMWSSVSSDADAAAALAEIRANNGVTLFSGIVNHSQALAPILACCVALVLVDMLFIVRRLSLMHAFLLLLALIELYMTRSRTGLFSCAVGFFMVLMYAVRRLQLSGVMSARIRKMATMGMVALCFAAIASEVVSGSMTRWLYKGIDSSRSDIDISEAVTSTRQALIDQSIAEFHMNPIWGMGFQVNFESELLYGGKGLVLSAPVEKGLLPLAILGEGGIVGVIAFIIFLTSFYATCVRKRLIITIAMFTTFLATNIGEATFFSPGGIGGILWMISVVGGFALDTLVLSMRHQESVNWSDEYF